MRTYWLIIILLLCIHTTTAQKRPMKFGDVKKTSLEMSEYPEDPTAGAVILHDFGYAYFDYSGVTGLDLKFERHVRIKILSEDGYDQADVEIPHYFQTNVEQLKAASYNLENGKIVEHKVGKDGMFEEKTSKRWRTKKFTFSNVKVGSVIEYSYRMKAGSWLYFKSWEFQKSIPVMKSEYWAAMPEYFRYKRLMQGYLPVSDYNSTSLNTKIGPGELQVWKVYNAPALKKEPHMSSLSNFQSRMDFELASMNLPGDFVRPMLPSYASFNRALLEMDDFGKQLEKTKMVQDKVNALVAGINDPKQKAEKLYNYVKNDIKWNEKGGLVVSTTLKKVFDDQEGTAADNNLLLVLMLKAAGLQSDGVIISTRGNGTINPVYPNLQKFNYTIAAVTIDSTDYLLDATDPLRPFAVLPSYCMNGNGRRISSVSPGWIPLHNKERRTTFTQGVLAMADDGSLTGQMNQSCSGFAAFELRKEIDSVGLDTYKSSFQNNKSEWVINQHNVEKLEEVAQPLKEAMDVELGDVAEIAGPMVYLNCMLGLGMDENPFNAETRVYPVDFTCPFDKMHNFSITLPEGYAVEELPTSVSIALPERAAIFQFAVQQAGNTIRLNSRFSVNKSLFSIEDYPMLREFYTQVLAKQAEQIVIKKL